MELQTGSFGVTNTDDSGPSTKDKNQACKNYYRENKELLLTQLNQYQIAIGNKTDSDLETENEELKVKLKEYETMH